MSLRPILLHPDPRLKAVAKPVAPIDDGVRRLAQDMLETMYDAPGIGLAAPQVGVMSRLLVMDCAKGDEPARPMVLVNPEVRWTSEETAPYEEGACRSPTTSPRWTRPREVEVRWTDLDGQKQSRRFDGLWAVCVQHEIDHLNGPALHRPSGADQARDDHAQDGEAQARPSARGARAQGPRGRAAVILPIVQLPDPGLREVARPVTEWGAELGALARDMLETMYDAPGRGLAAPQVGLGLRLFVMDVAWKEGAPDPQVFVNPEIVDASEEVVTREEGCLSIPGRTSRVARPAEVALRWQDLEGVEHGRRFEGFAATCVQHEIDHLDGILCIDREEPPPERQAE
jgi:peptide deformylase